MDKLNVMMSGGLEILTVLNFPENKTRRIQQFKVEQIIFLISKSSRLEHVFQYNDTSLSDHSVVSMACGFQEIARGEWLWILNNTILVDEVYKNKITDLR